MSGTTNTLRLVPPPPRSGQIAHLSAVGVSKPPHTIFTAGAPSAPTSVHDTLRHGLHSKAFAIDQTTKHPLEDRLRLWDENEENRKMEMLRRVFGMGEVLRRGMEMNFAGADYRPACLGGSSQVHLDILRNRDCRIGWEDVFTDDITRYAPAFHDELEARLRMNW